MEAKEKLLRLREVLKEKGVTSRELAEKLGTNHTYISVLMNHRGYPSLKKLYQIADALNVDVCELLVRNETGSPEDVETLLKRIERSADKIREIQNNQSDEADTSDN